MSSDTRGASPPTTPGSGLDFLQGGGEMGALIRAMDWSQTPLGAAETWPQSLRTTVSLCLSSTFPVLIAWGPERVQIYNDTYRPICGEKHPQSMGQRFNECWASALPAVGHVVDRAQGGEGSYIEDLRMFLDRYGYLEEAFMTFSFSPIRDESGGVGGLFHPITETTDRMLSSRRTQGVREFAAELGRATSMAQVGALIASLETRAPLDVPFLLFYALDEGGQRARLLGSAGVAEGSPGAPREVALDDERGWPLGRAVRALEPQRVEDVAERFGGFKAGPYPEELRTALLLPVAMPGASGAMGCLVAGVSTRRALDASYRAFYEQLQQTVTTAVSNVLAYEQEQARTAALAELDRAKTTFFSNVSHEFRTPLTLMLGPLESLLASTTLSGEQRDDLARVHRNGERLLKLVNSLLDFSRLEGGRVQASFAPVDLGALTTDLASTFRSLMEKAGLRLVVDAPPLPEPVYVDRASYEKVLLNLLSNAFKFTFEGEVRVELRAREGFAELAVSDTGCGIAADEVGRLFERFHRVQGARSRSFEGSGIGLALVQELVKLHGGEVSATSAPGVGTEFRVRLRFGHAHLPHERLGGEAQSSTSIAARTFVTEASYWLGPPSGGEPGEVSAVAEPTSARGGRILLVDDNADMRDYVQRLLQPRFTVEAAADGQAALDAARAHPPDLVLSDVMMPRLDGFGLLRALRADARTAHVPVVLLSARAGQQAAVEGLSAGASDYLIKPFSAPELIARVEGTMRTARARQDLDAFAGRIAHDLRNLLSPLPLIAAQVKLGDERSRKLAERLDSLTRRSRNLLDGMLAFSRSGGIHEEGASALLSATVADVVEDLSSLRAQVQAEVVVDVAEDATVALPHGLLYVVVLNLAQNALKFIRQRPDRRVTLATRRDEGVAVLTVADTGPGISASSLAHIFEPFYRAPGANASGHGIGLATVQRIIEASGGSLTVASVEGQGTTFTVHLPLASGRAVPP